MKAKQRRLKFKLLAATSFVWILVLVLVDIGLVAFPWAESLPKSDVIFVLGPPTPNRIAYAEELYSRGQASRILISVSPSGEPLSAAKIEACGHSYVDCVTPVPFTTKGEARMLNAYLSKRAVSSAIVITIVPHVSRSRFIFAKCSGVSTALFGVREGWQLSDWLHHLAYQSAAFVKAAITEC
ncbi:YdcF family protein [Microbacterium testaceum]|nr:YdcF family protein [Microbacterium testaceum]